MILVGSWQDALIDISVDDDLTSQINLGRECNFVLVEVPTITAADIKIQGARTTGGTFYTVAIKGAGTGQVQLIFDTGGYQFIKIGTSVAQAANRTLKVIGGRT